MTTDEQYVQLLRETSKLIPLVNLGTCSKVYKLCMKHQLFPDFINASPILKFYL